MTATVSRPRHRTVVKRIHDSSGRGGGGSPLATTRAALVVVLGVLGLVCLVLAALPFVGFRLIVLTTGSMSPGLPAGSLVVARDAPASEISLGDIVTVDRESAPPVTHRVIAVEPASSGSSSRTITMQGDGNFSPDPEPYVVDRVGIAALAVPWGGQLVFAMRSPWVTVGASIAIGLLVLWTWWPKQE
jgi:signal peptidase